MENSDTYRIVLFALLGIGGLAAFFLSRDKLRNGFLLFICTLGLGYRTYPVTQQLRILPAELILYLLVVLALRDRPLISPLPRSTGGEGLPRQTQSLKKHPRQTAMTLPVWLRLMIPFWAVAWLTISNNYYTWDIRLAEFRNFALVVPVFLVTPVVLSGPGRWREVVLTLLGVCTWIAGMGVLEYYFPGIAKALPGFMGNPDPTAAGGFQRASFSFYGSPIAVFICVLALPFSLAAWRWWPSARQRTLLIAACLLQLAAIYISGYRSMWLLVAVQVGLWIVMQKRYNLGIVLVLLALVAYGSLPTATRERLESLGHVLEGRPDDIDTSGKKRWQRAADALSSALENPAGTGWASSGWVHSDFLQVAANQGLIPGAIFLFAYVSRLWRLRKRPQTKTIAPVMESLHLSLLLSFSSVGGFLLFEGVQFLAQTILPVWLIWSLVEIWLSQSARASLPQRRAVPRLRRTFPARMLVQRA